MGILDRIAEIEREISRTQKNKATEYHLGVLKAKLAKYRAQLLEPTTKSSAKGEGFDVMKSGDARVALIGFPSVGKSTLLNTVTDTHSECASYEFTTLTCIPGVIHYKGANIQLLDLPGIIEGAAQGKGRGRQVIAVARTSDLVIIMLDATKSEIQRELLEKELESVGIRLNRRPPNLYFKEKKTGGISFNATCPLTKCDEKLVQLVLHEYKIFNAEILFREDSSVDDLLDVVLKNRVYLSCLYIYNKIDQISMEEVDRERAVGVSHQQSTLYFELNLVYNLKSRCEPPDFEDGLIMRRASTVEHVCHTIHRSIAETFKYALVWPHSVVVSCNMKLNLDHMLDKIWEHLGLIQVYTKKRGQPPDFEDGLIMRRASTVEHVCHTIHRSIAETFKYALVWGTSTKYSPQRVGLTHVVHHEDVVQIIKK
ncbi:unnamed protein product [Medioppia subpectinata]|uniref:Developmentally-regulated GTP-binding protein 2 n=1 Tax=Medioppia subpectinata TaxID=1979941 RepID=A0A7R9KCD9_9ACAR|nr:unnamed protein product [Medioppia subpectinata]CAG2100823.1 unnamed protein product [Medioppia subpectinata]